MSWLQWGEERVVSPDSTMALVKCPDCPSPGLVPLSEMTRHIGVLHRGDGFRCAVCKVRLDHLVSNVSNSPIISVLWHHCGLLVLRDDGKPPD